MILEYENLKHLYNDLNRKLTYKHYNSISYVK